MAHFTNDFGHFLRSSFLLFFTEIGNLALTLILLLLVPLGTPFALVLLLYRYVIQKVAPYLARSSLGAMITSRGAVFAGDAIFSRERPTVNLVLQGRLEARVEVERVVEIFKKALPAKKDGELKYPELQQFPTTWGGFFFWEWDPNFNLCDHVKYKRFELGPNSLSDKDEVLGKFHEDLVHKGWPKNKPIWEVWIVDVDEVQINDVINQGNTPAITTSIKTTCSIFVRTHHALTDGYSLLYFCREYLGKISPTLNTPKPVLIKRSPWRLILFYLTFPIRSVYELSSVIVRRYNPFVPLPFLAPFFPPRHSNVHIGYSKSIPIEKIKKIKNYHGVTFSSVMNAVLAGAVREIMIQKKAQIPTHFPILIPTPLKGHPEDSLRNYLGGAVLLLPTGESDPTKRLKACDKDYAKMKRSTFHLGSFVGLKVAGCMPGWPMWVMGRNWVTSSWYTSFPGGNILLSIDGVEMTEMKAVMGVFTGQTGLGFCAFSYKNDIRISITGNGNIFSKTDVRQIAELLDKQTHLLQSQIVLV